MPIRKPMAAGRKASFPIPELLSSAGCSRLQKDAATITPAAKPVSAFCILSEICFFRRKTIAAPRLVPRNGIRTPSKICIFMISASVFYFLPTSSADPDRAIQVASHFFMNFPSVVSISSTFS